LTNVQASSTGDVNQQGTGWAADSTRYVRAVRYSLPTLVTGLSFNVTQAFGQVAATGGHTGNTTGFDTNYVSGPLKLTAAYQKADADVANGANGELTTYGAIYNLGFASIGAGIQSEKASGGTNLQFKSADAFALTALFPMGATTPYIKYGERKYSGGTLGNITTAKVTNIGVRYAFSKTTYVYADYVKNGSAYAVDVAKQGSQTEQTNIGLTMNF
jgi:predicted porin